MKLKWDVGRKTVQYIHSYSFTQIYREGDREIERKTKESTFYFARSMNMWIMFYTLLL